MCLLCFQKNFTDLSISAVIKNYHLPAKQDIEFEAAIELPCVCVFA